MLLFADDVVLLASSGRDLQLSMERFATECEVAGMGISTSKSEAMVIDRKRVECNLRVWKKILTLAEEFKYLGVLFTSEGRIEREIDRRISAGSAVMRALHRSVVVKKELSRRAVGSDRKNEIANTSGRRVSRLSLRDRVRRLGHRCSGI